eukprot:3683681-Amphidinium_carterae.1
MVDLELTKQDAWQQDDAEGRGGSASSAASSSVARQCSIGVHKLEVELPLPSNMDPEPKSAICLDARHHAPK